MGISKYQYVSFLNKATKFDFIPLKYIFCVIYSLIQVFVKFDIYCQKNSKNRKNLPVTTSQFSLLRQRATLKVVTNFLFIFAKNF